MHRKAGNRNPSNNKILSTAVPFGTVTCYFGVQPLIRISLTQCSSSLQGAGFGDLPAGNPSDRVEASNKASVGDVA